MAHLAIIPARGGSKRLPGKNIKEIAGEPLISWTIKAAVESGQFDRVVVSTDCPKIANVSRQCGAEIPYLRGGELSGDSASSSDVVLDVLQSLNGGFETFSLLQPTSPLRTAEHIRGAYELLGARSAEGVVSVCEVEHSPIWSNRLPENMSLSGFLDEKYIGRRSQDLPIYYRLNGAIYIYHCEEFMKRKSMFYDDGVYAYLMDRFSSVDIDEYVDFLVAETLMKNRKA